MKLKLKRVLVLLLSLLLVFQTPLTALAKSDHAYKTEDPGVTVSFVPSDSGDRSLYEVILQNNSEKTITGWEVSFKTNFGLIGAMDVLYEKTRNNTYCFCDPENRTLPPGTFYVFTVRSDKKKNSEIHNVQISFTEVADQDEPTEPGFWTERRSSSAGS